MKSDSTLNVTQAQAKLPSLIKQDSFAISRHGKVMGVYLSRDRIEALVESMELLSNPDFQAALREFKAGTMAFYEVKDLDAGMSR